MNGVAMNTFTIDATNNITAFASLEEARAAKINNAEYFGSAQELAKLAASWPRQPPGRNLEQLRRGRAVRQPSAGEEIYQPQGGGGAYLEGGASVVGERGETGGPRRARQGEAEEGRPAKGKRRHTARAAAKDTAHMAREGSKKAEVIDRMCRSQGATLAEIMELTGWQAHTVRGFVSGTLIKKLGLKVESFRSKEKERTYRVK